MIIGGRWAAGEPGQEEQPDLEGVQSWRDHQRLEEEPAQTPSCLREQLSCGGDQQHRVFGSAHHRLHHLLCEHHITGKGAQHFLWLMRRSHLPSPIFSTFYKSTQENILTSCLSVRCSWKSVRRPLKTAEMITGSSLPTDSGLYIKAPYKPSEERHPWCLTPPPETTLLASGKKFIPTDGLTGVANKYDLNCFVQFLDNFNLRFFYLSSVFFNCKLF